MGGNPSPLLMMDGFRFLRARKFDHVKTKEMLLDAEKWRKEFGVDDIVKCVFFLFSSVRKRGYLFTDGVRRNFDFKEKEEVDKYYPQYYHKTDKVLLLLPNI